MIQASDAMSTNLVFLDVQTTIHEAANTMAQHQIGSIIVTEEGLPVGIVTETDMSRKVVARKLAYEDPIKKIMSSPLHTCSVDAQLLEVANMLEQKRIKKMPLVSENKLYGLITQTDIVRYVVSQVQNLATQYTQGTLSSEQYAQQSAALFHQFDNSLDEVSRSWHMICDSCKKRFMAEEAKGHLQPSKCPYCSSVSISYDQNPDI